MPIALFALAIATSAQERPSFRRPNASGVADGQNLPVQWDAQQSVGVSGRRESTGWPTLARSSGATRYS